MRLMMAGHPAKRRHQCRQPDKIGRRPGGHRHHRDLLAKQVRKRVIKLLACRVRTIRQGGIAGLANRGKDFRADR